MTTRFDVTGRRVLVTGASRGIGRAIALGFASAGASVFAVARTAADLASLAQELDAFGGRSGYLAVDLIEDGAAEHAVDEAAGHLGGLDVLVNNAGVDVVGSAFDISPADFDRVMRFNVGVNFALMKQAARYFLAGDGGKIVNVTSVLSSVAIRDDSAYIASKHGLLGLTRALALDWARSGIQVNALAPGFVATEMTRSDYEDEATLRSIIRRTPLGRPAVPAEIVDSAIFLASTAANYITGQTLYVDGGWTVQ
jgi:NAD(P)-dependent dehydrogenase (short-subunit alcohol dehydrogenase family)